MKILIAALCLTTLATLPAAAAVCADGQIAIVRVSTLKTGGTRAGFDKAVADQIAWYKSHGVTTNRIVTAEVIDFNGAPSLSTKEVMTIHYDPPAADGKQPPMDDAYKAFVKEFRDNSDITIEKTVCLKK